MSELSVYIEALKPNSGSPIAFFEWFIEELSLDGCKEIFLTSGQEDINGNKWYSINEEEETLTQYISYEGFYVDSDDFEIETIDKKQWYVIRYSFKDFLNRLLMKEYDASIDLITKQFPTSSFEQAKYLCLLWIDNLLYFRQRSKNKPYVKYPGISIALEGLIRYIIGKYPSFCPNIQTRPELKEIMRKDWGPQPQKGKRSLKTGIYKQLALLRDEDDKNLFEYNDNITENEGNKIAKALMHICSGQYLEDDTVLNFNWDAGPSNYLIKKLNEYNEDMHLKDIPSEKIIIKGKKFGPDKSSKAASQFKAEAAKNPQKAKLKRLIDKLFRDNEK